MHQAIGQTIVLNRLACKMATGSGKTVVVKVFHRLRSEQNEAKPLFGFPTAQIENFFSPKLLLKMS